jgi:hypothetical protein
MMMMLVMLLILMMGLTQTVRFKTELERNITIKLGYANAKIYKCDNRMRARARTRRDENRLGACGPLRGLQGGSTDCPVRIRVCRLICVNVVRAQPNAPVPGVTSRMGVGREWPRSVSGLAVAPL